jgi:signal transduction histidine kinase
MRIRSKSLIILSLITVVLTLSFYVISENSLLQRVKGDEQKIAEDNLLRLKMALASETESLSSNVADWSHWDDSYQFVQDNNTGFVDRNLLPQAFSDLDVNMMVFADKSGTIIFEKSYRLDNMTEMPVDKAAIKSVIDTLNQSSNDKLEGFIITNQGFMLVAARPIVKSNYEGPAQGTLIMGMLFDQPKILAEFNVVGLPVAWSPIDNSEMTDDILAANATLGEGTQSFVITTTETEISAFTVIKDINSKSIALVSVTDDRTAYVETKSEIFTISLLIAVMGIVFLLFSYLSMDRFVLSRLSNLDSELKRISESGSLKERTKTEGNDEISNLSTRINGMLDQLSVSQGRINDYALTLEKTIEEKKNELEQANLKLVKTERMAAIGEIAGMVGHDLRNPLSGIRNAVFLLKKKYRPLLGDGGTELLMTIDRAVEHSDKIINDLLDYSRELHLDREEISPKTLLSYTLLAINIPSQIKVLQKVQDLPKINVDPNYMQRVFTNLVKNAFDAMPSGGSLEISSTHDQETVTLSFADTGCGMSEDVRRRVFTPLFTTKAQGMGFGLSICKRVVEAHGGRIEVESGVNKGTKFDIVLPIKPAPKQS